MSGGRYDDPRYGVAQSMYLGSLGLNASASTNQAAFKAHTKIKLVEAYATTHGTGTADASGWNIYSGTTSIGAVLIGTATGGATTAASLTDTTIASGGQVFLKNANSDTQGTGFVTINYVEVF